MSVAVRNPSDYPARLDAPPIGDGDFERLMAPVGPFEDRPHLAVGVSGGRDSLALTLCASRWAAARGGKIDAVTIDHGIRRESAAEARQVGEWLAAHEIAHHVLPWRGTRVADGTEAAARDARYALLEEFCYARGILHLLVGHHADDQRETFELRRARRSGPDGLAGMPAVRETPHLRIVRPFLAVPRARITATLVERGLGWIEDPSNSDTRFARAAMRRAYPDGMNSDETTRRGGARVRRDIEAAARAARAIALHPAGFAAVDCDAFALSSPDTTRGLVAALARTIAGRRYPPRGARLDRLAGILRGGSLTRPRTLGGCIFRPADADRFLVHREFAAICLPGPVGTGTGRPVSWDGRFRISPAATVATHSRLGALGQFVESPREADLPESWRDSLPRAIWRTIPALENRGEVRVFAIAGLPETGVFAGTARFAPVLPVSGARFATPG